MANINEKENIYVFICAKTNLGNNTFEFSGIYPISPSANWENVLDHLTEDMKESFKEYIEGTTLPRVCITSMNEISKELYERLHQKK